MKPLHHIDRTNPAIAAAFPQSRLTVPLRGNPDRLEAERFLELLDPSAERFTFQTFDDNAKRKDPTLACVRHGTLGDLWSELFRLNAAGAGIFVTVNRTNLEGRRANDIVEVRAVWADDDNNLTGLPRQYPLEPDAVVETSPGKFHAYWFAKGMAPEDHAGIERTLVAEHGADPAAISIERVLRVPGFIHRKGDPFGVRIVGGRSVKAAALWGEPAARRSCAELLRAFPPSGRTFSAKRSTSGPRVVGDLDTPSTIAAAVAYLSQAPRAVQGSRGDNMTIEVANKVLDKGVSIDTAFELMAERWNAECSPPWDLDDLEQKIKNAANSRQAPIGCDNPAAGFVAVELTPDIGPDPIANRPQLFEPSAARWLGKDPERAPFVVERIVPRGYVTVIGAAGGRGKSAFGLQIMVCVAAGLPFLGYSVEEGAAAGIFCEDADADLHRRTKDICSKLDVSFESIADRLSPTSFLQADAALWREGAGPTEFMAEIERALAGRDDARVLVVDGAADTFAASENDRTQVSRFMSALSAFAARRTIAVILIMHESKSTADDDIFAFSGSTAWLNKSRSALKIASVEGNRTKRAIKHIKCNGGPLAPDIECALDGFTFKSLGGDAVRAGKCKSTTNELILRAFNSGLSLSPNSRATNYAARWLHENQSGTDFTVAEFDTALANDMDLSWVIEKYRAKKSGKESERYAPLIIAGGWRAVPGAGGSGRSADEPPAALNSNDDGRHRTADGSSKRAVA